MKKMEIIETNYGMAQCLIDTKTGKQTILINKNLKKYPKLYTHLLNHELKHYEYKSSITKNFLLDVKDLFFKPLSITYQEILFTLNYPLDALRTILPIDKSSFGWVIVPFNILLIILFIIIAIIL